RLLHDRRWTRHDRRRARVARGARPVGFNRRRRGVDHRTGALLVPHLEAGDRTMNVGIRLVGLLLTPAMLPAAALAQGESSAVFVVRVGADTFAVERATIGSRR